MEKCILQFCVEHSGFKSQFSSPCSNRHTLHRSTASHWQTITESCISQCTGIKVITLAVIGNDCIGRCKNNLSYDRGNYSLHTVLKPHRWRNGLRASLECGRSCVRARSDQTKEYKIGICCFSAKHAALRRKSKDWLAQNQNNVSEWSNISTCGLLFQWASTKNPAQSVGLV